MDNNCQLVVFSDKAYNAIIRETFEWDPVETGGILLGHILDNGCWIVMEVLPPGYGEGREGDNVYHEYGYFEYNRKFVNYLAKSVAGQYEIPLELLGLWHRHPGSMDHFSGTDDGTNTTFALQNPHGVISGLINIDPQLRLTMYYLSHEAARGTARPPYQEIEVEVGSDLIPEDYFKLKYYKGAEKDLHPYAPQRQQKQTATIRQERSSGIPQDSPKSASSNPNGLTIDTKSIVDRQLHQNSRQTETIVNNDMNSDHITTANDLIERLKKNKIKLTIILVALIAFFFSLLSIKNDVVKGFHFSNDEDQQPKIHIESDDGKMEEKDANLQQEDHSLDIGNQNSDAGEGKEKQKQNQKLKINNYASY